MSPYAGDAISMANNLSVARLNFFLRRCTMPTGRTNPGAFNFTATRRPCSISACMVRAGRMLIPSPSATASYVVEVHHQVDLDALRAQETIQFADLVQASRPWAKPPRPG